jgi:hypothetical protein
MGNIIRKIGDVIKRAKAWKQEDIITCLARDVPPTSSGCETTAL